MKRVASPVNVFCKRVGIGRTKAFQLIRDGELDVIKVGRRTLILEESIRALVERSRQGRAQ